MKGTSPSAITADPCCSGMHGDSKGRYLSVLPSPSGATDAVCVKPSSEQGLLAAGVLVAVLAVGASLAVATDEGRAPVKVVDASATDGGREVRLAVNTCGGDPDVEVVSQGSDEVVISVISDVQTGEGPACLDAVSLRLQAPIADRDLRNVATGRRIWVPPSERR